MIGKLSAAVGIAVAALGAVVWGVTLAIATPSVADVRAGGDFAPGQLLIWAQELRQAAIVLAACGFLLFFDRFRGALLTVLAGAGILLIGDVMLKARDVSGLGAAVSISAGAGILGLAALGLIPLTKELDEGQRTRRRAALAIVTAYCAPAVLFNAKWGENNDVVPWQFTVATAIVATGFAALSVACVMSASARYRYFTAAACVVPLVVAANFAGLPADDYALALGMPLAAVAIVAMRDAISITLLRTLWRRVAFLVGAVLLTLPAGLFTIVFAMALGEPLLNAGGDSMPADGLPYLPGALTLAVTISAATLLRRPPKPATQPSEQELESLDKA